MKKAGDILNIFFNEIERKQSEDYLSFYQSWKKIAGNKIGENTTIKDIIDGTLFIEIDHPGWKQLIMIKEKNILRQINNKYPELSVKKIRYNFKKSSNEKIKNIKNEKIIKKNIVKNEIENEDFSQLLKKMRKRSQE